MPPPPKHTHIQIYRLTHTRLHSRALMTTTLARQFANLFRPHLPRSLSLSLPLSFFSSSSLSLSLSLLHLSCFAMWPGPVSPQYSVQILFTTRTDTDKAINSTKPYSIKQLLYRKKENVVSERDCEFKLFIIHISIGLQTFYISKTNMFLIFS